MHTWKKEEPSNHVVTGAATLTCVRCASFGPISFVCVCVYMKRTVPTLCSFMTGARHGDDASSGSMAWRPKGVSKRRHTCHVSTSADRMTKSKYCMIDDVD